MFLNVIVTNGFIVVLERLLTKGHTRSRFRKCLLPRVGEREDSYFTNRGLSDGIDLGLSD